MQELLITRSELLEILFNLGVKGSRGKKGKPTVSTVIWWEKKGLIPKPPILNRGGIGIAIYTETKAKEVIKKIAETRAIKVNDKQIEEQINLIVSQR